GRPPVGVLRRNLLHLPRPDPLRPPPVTDRRRHLFLDARRRLGDRRGAPRWPDPSGPCPAALLPLAPRERAGLWTRRRRRSDRAADLLHLFVLPVDGQRGA